MNHHSLCAITADPVCEGHTTVHIILISAFSEYRPLYCTFTF